MEVECTCPSCKTEQLKAHIAIQNGIIKCLAAMLAIHVERSKSPRQTARYEELIAKWNDASKVIQ